MPRNSQRKGRAGERSVHKLLKDAGIPARLHTIWEADDLTVWVGGLPYRCEVKRRNMSGAEIEKYFDDGIKIVVFRGDRQRWKFVFAPDLALGMLKLLNGGNRDEN